MSDNRGVLAIPRKRKLLFTTADMAARIQELEAETEKLRTERDETLFILDPHANPSKASLVAVAQDYHEMTMEAMGERDNAQAERDRLQNNLREVGEERVKEKWKWSQREAQHKAERDALKARVEELGNNLFLLRGELTVAQSDFKIASDDLAVAERALERGACAYLGLVGMGAGQAQNIAEEWRAEARREIEGEDKVDG